MDKITPSSFGGVSGRLGGSHGTDVTGGMGKVEQMLELVRRVPGVSGQIFSGEERGNVERALQGEQLGTLVESD